MLLREASQPSYQGAHPSRRLLQVLAVRGAVETLREARGREALLFNEVPVQLRLCSGQAFQYHIKSIISEH